MVNRPGMTRFGKHTNLYDGIGIRHKQPGMAQLFLQNFETAAVVGIETFRHFGGP